MSNVSHELLTPASILQSRFENMLQDPTLPEQHAQQIVESQRTLYRLRNTVRTLLLIANIENEQYLRNESVRLSDGRGRGGRGTGRPPPAARHRPGSGPGRRRHPPHWPMPACCTRCCATCSPTPSNTTARAAASGCWAGPAHGGYTLRVEDYRARHRPRKPCLTCSTGSGVSTPTRRARRTATAWACPLPKPLPASTGPRCGPNRTVGRGTAFILDFQPAAANLPVGVHAGFIGSSCP